MLTNLEIDANRRTPKYLQIANSITKAIKQGKYKKGDRIFSINELSNECFLSRDTVQKAYDLLEKERIIEVNGQLIPQINGIFFDPNPSHSLDYRAHFFAPQKYLFGATVSTYLFDVLVIWLMTLMLYITLYFELLRKLINSFDKVQEKVNLPKVVAKKN